MEGDEPAGRLKQSAPKGAPSRLNSIYEERTETSGRKGAQMQANQAVTIRAVIRYAADLRGDAARIVVRDVWAKPYAPTESYARKLSAQLGPEGAIAYLRGRVAQAQRLQAEEREQAKRSLERHKRQQKDAIAARTAKVAHLRPGQRIDLALAELTMVASPAAANPEPGVSGGDSDHTPKFTVDSADAWKRRAKILAEEIEYAVFQARTRDLTERAA